MSNETMMTVRARIRMLSTEEGGRHTPFISTYRPNFSFGARHNQDGQILLLDRQQMPPGAQGDVHIRFVIDLERRPAPAVDALFVIREGKIVGEGIVLEIVSEESLEPIAKPNLAELTA